MVTVDCGTPVDLSALGLSPTPALATNFNGGVLGPGWSTSVNAQYSNPCGPTLDGTPALWFGNVPAPRTLTTVPFDVSCGGQICFDFDMATQGASSPCEGPDLVDEGVYFEYSTDGGATWVDIFYFQPGPGGTSGPYLNWANYCFLIPPGAMTTSTIFQWDQLIVSGATFDHWGVDNITIIPSDCNFWYDWSQVPGFPDSSDQVVTPSDTTTYYVTYTDGTIVCLDSVIVNVNPLEVDIVANPNPLECGDCADLVVEFLNGSNGSVVDDFEGGIDPFMWGDIQSGTASTICDGLATGSSLYFNGPGLQRHAETVPIDATVCGNIDFCLYMGNTASGGGSCDNNENGEDVILEYSIDAGVSFIPISTYPQSLWDGNNTQQCFSQAMPAGAQTTSTIFRWRQVLFTALNNSDNWSLDNVVVSCNSPAILYDWSTGTVDNPVSPTPSACPTVDQLYTVSVNNTLNGCTATDTSTLFVNTCNCSIIQFDGTVVCQPGGLYDVTGTFEYSYSPTTGTIEVEATNGTGTYSQSFNLPFTDSTVFNYTISGIPNDGSPITMDVYFSDSLSCSETFTLTPPVLPTITGISGGAEYCAGAAIAPVTVTATGTGPWTVAYTLNGAALAVTSATSPITLGTTPGVYVLVGVQDAICINTAAGTQTITVNSLPTVNAGGDLSICDGDQATLSGTGAATYVWNNGATNGTPFTPPVGATTYTVTGTDANGCVNTDAMIIFVTAYPPAPGASPVGGEYCSSSDEIPPFVASGSGQSFTWYSNPTLTTTLGTDASLQPLIIEGTTNYYVTQSMNGCEGPPTTIGIFLENCEATIVMPNVFSPNADGTNTLFHPVFMDGVTSAETVIINRWGNTIFQTSDQQINWDGKDASGKEVEEGTYFWKMTYQDLNFDEFIIHGNVQVVR